MPTCLPACLQVVSFLKSMGLKDEYLAARVFCVWPEVLSRDVEGQIRPVITCLMNLGEAWCMMSLGNV